MRRTHGPAPFFQRSMTQLRLRQYSDARLEILDADLLLWRPTDWRGRLICRGTGEPYCHAGMAAWVYDEYGAIVALMSLETLQHRAGPVVPLSRYVREYSGAVDVWRVCLPDYDRAAAVEYMWRRAPAIRYGWLNLARIGLSYALSGRFPPSADDAAAFYRLPSCAVLCGLATEAGGVDPVPGCAPEFVSPGKLSEGGVYQYQFTLVRDLEG